MASQVILKKSSVAARVPVVGDLAFGELALNYADGLLYYKKSDGSTVAAIGTTGISSLTDTIASWAVVNTFAGVLNPTDVFFKSDGTKMFVSVGATLNQYTLSTAWDITTAGTVTSFTNTWDTVTNGIFISPDGTKLITCGQTAVVNAGLGIVAAEDRAYYLTLSTAWDITTATLVSSLRFAINDAGLPAAETAPQGITFNDTGTIMYVVGSTNDNIYQYTLTTAYNVATATYSKQLSIASVEAGGTGIRFNTAGTRLYLIGSTSDSIVEYRLTTAWDIATAVVYDKIYVGNLEATTTGIFLDESSGNAYIVGTANDLVTRYKTNSLGVALTPTLSTGRIDLIGETRVKGSSLYVNGNINADGSLTVGTSALIIGSLTANNIITSSTALTLGQSASGAITIGSTTSTGAITLGQSTAAQTLNLSSAATAASTTKTINIGTSGVSTSITNINYGSAVTGALNTHTWNAGAANMSLTSTGALAFTTATGYGTAGQVLTSQGDAAPVWSNSITLSAVVAPSATDLTLTGAGSSTTAGTAYAVTITGGTGGDSTAAGKGGAVNITGGRSGNNANSGSAIYGGTVNITGGAGNTLFAQSTPGGVTIAGGAAQIAGQAGASVSIYASAGYSSATTADGGNLTLSAGAGGGASGNNGYVSISAPGQAGGTLPYIVLTTGVTERLRITGTGAWALAGASNYGTSNQVLTSQGNSAPVWANAPLSPFLLMGA